MRLNASAILPLALAAVLLPSPVTAAGVFADISGTDSGSCGASSSACRTLQQAVTNASAGDTVFLTVAGDYGPATIDKTLFIQAVKGAGVFSPPSVPCITVDGDATTRVGIVELTCDQDGAAQHGIVYLTANSLRFDRVDIRGGTGGKCGLFVNPSTDAVIGLSHTTISNFSGGNGGGICVTAPAGIRVWGMAERATLDNNQNGVVFTATAGGPGAAMFFSYSDIHTNNVGVNAIGTAAKIYLRTTDVSSNFVMGLKRSSGGQIVSSGLNSVKGNAVDGTFSSISATE